MTEAEWLTSTDPQAMLDILGGREGVTERKLRLFACACCRRIWHLLTDERSRKAVDSAEAFADGRASEQQVRIAERAADAASTEHPLPAQLAAAASVILRDGDAYDFSGVTAFAASRASALACDAITYVADSYSQAVVARRAERAAQAALLRCIFGNPFRPPPRPDAAWLTPLVLGLAETVYEHRSFEQLSELADLLADASCHDSELIGHLRGPGAHARGCWAVDLLLGKA
jgi:hypothetical protein